MNEIVLSGYLRNIRYSHNIGDIQYDRAEIITKRDDGKEDVLSVRFKKFSNPYLNDQFVDLIGNIRSFSERGIDGKNHVLIYVHTYFDIPPQREDGKNITNEFLIDGRICKIDGMRSTKDGKNNYHFTLANNIISQSGNQKLNTYLPLVAWGKLANKISELKVGDYVCVRGQLHSRQYKKILESGELEYRTAYEGVVFDFTTSEVYRDDI